MKTRIICIIITLGVLMSLITGCSRGAHSSVKEMMKVLPDDISTFMSYDLEALRADDDLEDMYDSMFGSEDEFIEELGIYSSEINTIAVAYSYDYDMWGFIKGDYDIDDILDTFEDNGYDQDEYRGVETWSTDYEVYAFLKSMLVTADNEDPLRACIRLSTDQGTSMYSNEDYRDVLDRLPAGIITTLMQEEYEEYLAAGFTMRKSTGTNDTMEINGCLKFSSEQEAKNNIQQMEDNLESGDAYNINLNQKGEFIEATWEIDLDDFNISIIIQAATDFETGPPPPQEDTVVLGEGDWDSSAVQTRIAAFILENGYDYEVQFELGGTIPLAAALTRGDVDVLIEAWTESTPDAYADAFADGSIVELGIDFADSWQGWLVPTYMITNGDLPAGISVEDMPDYWELFEDQEDPSKGRFYNCIPGWVCEETNTMKFDAYGLSDTYNLFPSRSGAALVASMVAAYEAEEPWFGYYWEPTWAMGKYDMTKVEEPTFEQGIWDSTRGCAYPRDKVVTLATTDFVDREPTLAEFFTKWEVTAAMLNKALAYIEDNEATPSEAAVFFLQEYESVWTEWVSADIASKVNAALPK